MLVPVCCAGELFCACSCIINLLLFCGKASVDCVDCGHLVCVLSSHACHVWPISAGWMRPFLIFYLIFLVCSLYFIFCVYTYVVFFFSSFSSDAITSASQPLVLELFCYVTKCDICSSCPEMLVHVYMHCKFLSAQYLCFLKIPSNCVISFFSVWERISRGLFKGS